MQEKIYMTVQDVADMLGISKSKAYEIVRQMNQELQEKGYLTVAGRVNSKYFHKRVCYED